MAATRSNPNLYLTGINQEPSAQCLEQRFLSGPQVKEGRMDLVGR
jgi:hypothetical protein